MTLGRIETNCMNFDVRNLTAQTLVECKCRNVDSPGGFRYDCALGAKFVRCEASRVSYGDYGDGFNGHNTNRKDDDPKARGTTCELIDCWSHDNYDDGYSDHEASETIIRGGLFEWNGKGGVVPSFGSHLTCYDVMSRHNNNGFNYVGEPNDAGMYGQIVCYNCVAESNDNTLWGTATNELHGFNITGANNSAILINCKSINNPGYQYRLASGSCMAKLIDCGAINNGGTGIRNQTGSWTIYNSDKVE
jgi:hypothetical protein